MQGALLVLIVCKELFNSVQRAPFTMVCKKLYIMVRHYNSAGKGHFLKCSLRPLQMATTVTEYVEIFEYIRKKNDEYTNIFVSKFWYERISEYIRIQKMIRTNVRINIRIKNIRIFEYSNIFVTLCTACTHGVFSSLQSSLQFNCSAHL